MLLQGGETQGGRPRGGVRLWRCVGDVVGYSWRGEGAEEEKGRGGKERGVERGGSVIGEQVYIQTLFCY